MFQKSCRLSRWKSCRVYDPFLYLQLLDAVALQTFISKQLVYMWPINKYRLFTVPYVFVRSSVLPAAILVSYVARGWASGLMALHASNSPPPPPPPPIPKYIFTLIPRLNSEHLKPRWSPLTESAWRSYGTIWDREQSMPNRNEEDTS